MRLATIIDGPDTRAVRVEDEGLVLLPARDVGELLHDRDWRAVASTSGQVVPAESARMAPVVVNPGKIICAGLNYRAHIEEMGRPVPQFPTLFTKFSESLIGANDPIQLPPESNALDWEAEIAVIVGTSVRRADRERAMSSIAGYTLLNDVTARDWQNRTAQWLPGKTFEGSTPIGPWLVTPEELAPDVRIEGLLNGEVVQSASFADLVFDAADLITYISTFVTLNPGDVIATGTPGGVGHAETPPRYLSAGDVFSVRATGLGALNNVVS
jgi:acylpyruvate hydrolase